jgi:hypothetical protein
MTTGRDARPECRAIEASSETDLTKDLTYRFYLILLLRLRHSSPRAAASPPPHVHAARAYPHDVAPWLPELHAAHAPPQETVPELAQPAQGSQHETPKRTQTSSLKLHALRRRIAPPVHASAPSCAWDAGGRRLGRPGGYRGWNGFHSPNDLPSSRSATINLANSLTTPDMDTMPPHRSQPRLVRPQPSYQAPTCPPHKAADETGQ